MVLILVNVCHLPEASDFTYSCTVLITLPNVVFLNPKIKYNVMQVVPYFWYTTHIHHENIVYYFVETVLKLMALCFLLKYRVLASFETILCLYYYCGNI